MKKIYLATDHAGFQLKEELKNFLENKEKENLGQSENFEIEDCGAFFENKKDDYPDFIFLAAEKVSANWTKENFFKNELGDEKDKKKDKDFEEIEKKEKFSKDFIENNFQKDLAIIFGGSGQGEAMVANRLKNVRATTYYAQNKEILKLSKEHNNANILSIGARFFKTEEEKKVLFNDILFWINFEFSKGERHQRRIKKIEKITDEFYALKRSENGILKNPDYLKFLKGFFNGKK